MDLDNKPDMVYNPPHYKQGEIECIDAMEAHLSREEFIGYLRGSIIKYEWRLTSKANPVEDARKMGWYLGKLTQKLMEE